MSDAILLALGKLDPHNDNHWTGDGLPRVETVQLLAADQSITRGSITAAAPNFTRETALAAELPAPGNQAQEPPVNGSGNGTPVIKDDENGTSNEDDTEVTLVGRLERERKTLAEMKAVLAEANRELAEQQQLVNELEEEYEAGKPRETSQMAIQGYLESQNRQRAKRAERVQELLSQGIDKKIVSSALRSPLDNARAGKK